MDKVQNFLFANTARGAKASAIVFSLIETAKGNGLNPYTYLTYIFQNAPNWNIRNELMVYKIFYLHSSLIIAKLLPPLIELR